MQEGDICRYRLVIPPGVRGFFAVVAAERWGQVYRQKWQKTIQLLTTQGLSVSFYAEPCDKGRQGIYVLDADFRRCPDAFVWRSGVLCFAYNGGIGRSTLLPEEYVGHLPGATLSVDFFPEAQRLCVAWIKCAKCRQVHRDTIRMIGRLLLSTWNDLETWYNVGVIKRGKVK